MWAAIAGCGERKPQPQVASVCLFLQTPEEYVGRPLLLTADVYSSAGIDYAMLIDPACPGRGVRLVLDHDATGDVAALVAAVNSQARNVEIGATFKGTLSIVSAIRQFTVTNVSGLTVRAARRRQF